MVSLKVADVMTKKPVVVKPNISVEQGAKLMLKNEVGNLIIQENGNLKGIITEKDFVERVVAKSVDAKKTMIKDVMSVGITATITPDRDIVEAMRLMTDKKVRRLPVVSDRGKLVGMLTSKDIIKVQPELINLRLDTLNIKDEEFKPNRFFEGECSKCGNFTLLEQVGNKVLCSDCKYKVF